MNTPWLAQVPVAHTGNVPLAGIQQQRHLICKPKDCVTNQEKQQLAAVLWFIKGSN